MNIPKRTRRAALQVLATVLPMLGSQAAMAGKTRGSQLWR